MKISPNFTRIVINSWGKIVILLDLSLTFFRKKVIILWESCTFLYKKQNFTRIK